MISFEEFERLCRAETMRSVEENLERDPVAIALDRRVTCAADVATQVKYLQRARRKLPSYYEARCIIPQLAFEQSSGEICAARKDLRGGSVLDLTCGLGVDAFGLSSRFERVVTVERNEVLAAVARENFRRLGVSGIEVVCDTAEHFASVTEERFDWCFADPDRRGADGGKRVLLEDCSPDVTRLIPLLAARGTASRFCIKLSPMFDVEEAFRIFGRYGRCSVEAVSSGDECKEVLVYVDSQREPRLSAVVADGGSFSAAWPLEELRPETRPFEPSEYGWAIFPDVALVKARLVRRCFGGTGWVSGENGVVFCKERPAEGVLGRVFGIAGIERYDARRLRRELKGLGVGIMLRDVPLTAARIRQATGLREGGDLQLAFTRAAGEIWVIRLK